MNEVDWKKIFIILGGLVLIVSLLVSGYLFYQYKKAARIIDNPKELTKAQNKKIIEQVGKLISLPDEEPTVASVLDKNKLKDQPFFRNAENGDVVLIYTKAKKAILYRPSTNKIIEVAPINVGATGGTTVSTPSATIGLPTPTKKLLSPTPTPTQSGPKPTITLEPSPTP